MLAVPQSEIRVKFLASQSEKTGEKWGEILAKCFADFRPSISIRMSEKGGYGLHIRTSNATRVEPTFRNPFAPCRGQNPLNWEKRVSESKTPISRHLRKGHSESKNPHLFTGNHRENVLGGGKWGFFDSETLFSQFWGF